MDPLDPLRVTQSVIDYPRISQEAHQFAFRVCLSFLHVLEANGQGGILKDRAFQKED